jgi:hypothetical protein
MAEMELVSKQAQQVVPKSSALARIDPAAYRQAFVGDAVAPLRHWCQCGIAVAGGLLRQWIRPLARSSSALRCAAVGGSGEPTVPCSTVLCRSAR